MNRYLELTKPGITVFVALTAAAGSYLGAASLDVPGLFHILLGTALSAGGTNALNQWWERDADALMRRTAARPIPAGHIGAPAALAAALGVSGAGLLYLLVFTNQITAALAALSVASYVLVYTPLKRRTPAAVLVGALPGALPILGGWTAATGRIDFGGTALFLILFLWQLPHFLALAWLYRDDYRAGGFRMLSRDDPAGRAAVRGGFAGTLGLVAASVLPASAGLVTPWYLVAAAFVGGVMLVRAVELALRATPRTARRLFFASLAYLPLVLLALVITKIRS